MNTPTSEAAMYKPRQFVRTVIAEPFPVFYSHVNYSHCRTAGHPDNPGPFYVAGSEYFDAYSEKALQHRLFGAEHLRRDGYTVTVDIVTR